MEEILASIRRIISEDDAPGGATPGPEEEPVHAAAEEPIPFPPAEEEPVHEEDGALELTDRVESHGDLDVYASEPEPEPEPAYEAPSAYAPDNSEGLVGDPAASAAAAHFGQLSSTILMPADGRTLEDVVRELLRPLLKGWLDEHLPNIVQTAVQAEVERIARGRIR